jgi:hypothetical protein
MRGRKEKAGHLCRARPRSPSSIASLPVRCKENPLRPGPTGVGVPDRGSALQVPQAPEGVAGEDTLLEVREPAAHHLELPPAIQAPGSPESASEGPGSTMTPTVQDEPESATQRPWWRRLIGG